MKCRLLSPHLNREVAMTGCVQLDPQAFAEALMIIPKVLAQNSGFDPQDSLVKLQVSILLRSASFVPLHCSIIITVYINHPSFYINVQKSFHNIAMYTNHPSFYISVYTDHLCL